MQNIITSKPKVIITQIGGDDIAKDDTTIDSTTRNYTTLLSEVKAKFLTARWSSRDCHLDSQQMISEPKLVISMKQ